VVKYEKQYAREARYHQPGKSGRSTFQRTLRNIRQNYELYLFLPPVICCTTIIKMTEPRI